MNAVIIALSVVLPLLPIVLFPTKFIGRGGAWKFVGAGLLVGMMMLLFFSLQSATDDTAKAGGDSSALAGISDADLSALQKLF